MLKLTAAVDFGSTYTKVAAFDLEKKILVGTARAKTTVESNIAVGLKKALKQLEGDLRYKNREFHIERMLSCSSAAGGLRMIVIGLTKALTTKAAGEAVLGAGAKLIDTYSYRLVPDDIKDIEAKEPDLILLAGGTDGGDEKNIIQNAQLLAQCQLKSPIIIGGNKSAAHKVRAIFKKVDKYAVIAENILPELERLNIEPARKIIREIFIERITHAKGLDNAREIVGNIIMPTPMAVLNGAELLSKGTKEEEGWGDLLLVDVGGATTDVHSIGYGHTSQTNTIVKGLAEPFAKRTVEGDLGIRYNASLIIEKFGEKEILKKLSYYKSRICQREMDINSYIKHVSRKVEHVAQNEEESLIDIALASKAVETAIQRHAGKIEEVYFPTGKVRVQYGKDLSRFNRIIGTGGIVAYSQNPGWILESACFDASRPESLRPVSPQFFVDENYILFAVGLLSEFAPTKALRIIKKYLRFLTGL